MSETLRKKILSKRLNEFEFSKVKFLNSDKDVFPNKIHISKRENCEPTKVYSLNTHNYETMTSYTYVIGELEWDDKESCWNFRSIGTRYLKDGTDKCNKWILDFCEKYSVIDGELVENNVQSDTIL